MFKFLKRFQMPTLEKVVQEWLEINYADNAEKTRFDTRRRFERYVLPELGTKKINRITTDDIVCILKNYEQAAPRSVNRLFQQLVSVFDFADAKTGFALENPVKGSLKAVLRKQKSGEFNFIKPADMADFFRSLHRQKMKNDARAALLLLIFTALRRQEVCNAHWSEMDLDNAIWTIPANRMKTRHEHTVILSKPMVKMLRHLQLNTRGDAVFNVNANTLLRHIKAASGDITLHGFRKTFSTYANESGLWSIDAIEATLSHKLQGVRGVYNKAQYLEERKKLMNWYAKELNKWGARHIIAQVFRE